MTPRKPGDYNADLVKLFKRFVKASAHAKEKFVELPTWMAVDIVPMLERVPKPRGRQRISGQDRVEESTVLLLARARKRELIAAGMPKGKATDQAAEEAAAQLSKTRLLSVSTIKRRMQRRLRR
jgi:hypothetical protein